MQTASKPLDVDRSRRVSREQVLGGEARIGGVSVRQMSVRKLSLGALEDRLQHPVDADFHQPHQRLDMILRSSDEFLQPRGGSAPFPSRHCRVDRQRGCFECRLRRGCGELAAECGDAIAQRRVVAEQRLRDGKALVDSSGTEVAFGRRQRQCDDSIPNRGRGVGQRQCPS